MRIELCGGIASGKTTLAAALQERFPDCRTVFENAFSGDFLNDFYFDPKYYAYETEIFFLLQHMHQIKAGQYGGGTLICDFSLEQDYSYGENNLEQEELASFQQIYRVTMRQLRKPDLIIFLECPAEILLRRIAARGRASEASVDMDYLRTTVSLLKKRLEGYEGKVVAVNSNQYDFRKSEDISRLLSGPLSLCKQILCASDR